MRFASATLENFRNLPLVTVALAGRRTFLLGRNGQGKTNFLEALGYVTALRSFRGAEPRALVGWGAGRAGLSLMVEHEMLGASRITVTLGPEGRVVEWDQGRVARLADFIGRFPTVVFSSQDHQWLRGAPALRRRWLDLTLAAMDGGYLAALQGYTRAVAERNRLLKAGGRDAGSLAAFEHEAARHGAGLASARRAGVAELGALLRHAHARLAPAGEAATLVLVADASAETPEALATLFARSRARDVQLQSTGRGPHRDDLDLTLAGRPARQSASEGQQRCLVLALRLAQAEYFRAKRGVQPVLLCDDVLGELDPERRRRFWAALDGEPQVVATGTTLPEDGGEWQVLTVAAGRMVAEPSPVAGSAAP